MKMNNPMTIKVEGDFSDLAIGDEVTTLDLGLLHSVIPCVIVDVGLTGAVVLYPHLGQVSRIYNRNAITFVRRENNPTSARMILSEAYKSAAQTVL